MLYGKYKEDFDCCNANNHNIGCGQYDNCYYKQLQRLKQENEKLKETIKSINKPIYLPNIEEEATNIYRKALEEIRNMTKKYDAEVGDTIIANPIQDCYDIYCKINEVLDNESN